MEINHDGSRFILICTYNQKIYFIKSDHDSDHEITTNDLDFNLKQSLTESTNDEPDAVRLIW